MVHDFDRIDLGGAHIAQAAPRTAAHHLAVELALALDAEKVEVGQARGFVFNKEAVAGTDLHGDGRAAAEQRGPVKWRLETVQIERQLVGIEGRLGRIGQGGIVVRVDQEA